MIYFTGDTHGQVNRFNNDLTKDDYLIVLGDFGLIWKSPSDTYYDQQLARLNALNKYTTLVVLGNHENYDEIAKYPIIDMLGAKVRKVTDHIYVLLNGEIYTIDNQKFFVMGGAKSIDKANRIPNISWWEQELPKTIDYEKGLSNLDRQPIDYILSHETCAKGYANLYKYYELYDLPKYLSTIKEKYDYRLHLHGHHHIDQQVCDKTICLFNDIKTLGQLEQF